MNDSSGKKRKSDFKLSIGIEPDASDERLSFIKQLGVDCVYCWIDRGQVTLDYVSNLRERIESFGLRLNIVKGSSVAKSDKIQLGLPGRDEKIEEFKKFIGVLGRSEIDHTTFTWEPSGVWSSEPGETRGAKTRRVDLEEMEKRPLTHGRKYGEEEIWENYRYFVEKIIPAAERNDVRLLLHPNDPPARSLGGVPSLIRSFDDYQKAFRIADSDYLGMEFCLGCWLEGGKRFGDVLEGLRHFGKRGKISTVHFRNVSSPLPTFVETFPDNGYMDMHKAIRVLRDIGYEGTITPDHMPDFASGFNEGTGEAYAIGYIRGLLDRAEENG